MLIFKGDALLAGDGDGSFDWPDRPSEALRCSLDFPESSGDAPARLACVTVGYLAAISAGIKQKWMRNQAWLTQPA